ncbi:hypothetical protein AB4Y32_00960 [Paraburkholderia phymatum]|uniref:Uncharacterized protein n=1 Tax=Paraburkholderia phymatum TaxID=148447 RepID=A0ACC6TSM9_9BURK
MADLVSPLERRNCWLVMSDLFVDSAVDYQAVAEALVRDCPNMTQTELKRMLFEEVAPVLGTNGLTPAPSVWTGFDGDAVIRDIGDRLAQQHLSLLARARDALWNAICRLIFRSFYRPAARAADARKA